MNDPNDSRYFDEETGMTLNDKCVACEVDIWHSTGIHTVYHGKRYLHNKCNMVMSVYHESLGFMCDSCFGEYDDK